MLINPENNSIAFGMMVHAESPALVERCIQFAYNAYPSSPIVIFLDGLTPGPEWSHVFLNRTMVVFGDRLKKGVDNGAAIWTRFFSNMLGFRTEYIVKMDPDTLIHRKLHLLPTQGLDSSGRLMSAGYDAQHIQGGFQIFSRMFAKAALIESMNSCYKSPESWKCGQSDVFTKRDLVSTDYLLRVITRAIGGTMIDHPELDCRSIRGTKPFDPAAAVTHPHKSIDD